MPSQHNSLKKNVNGSKNTRMDFDDSQRNFDYRVDEIMFLGRYNACVQAILDLAVKLKRPVRVLDVGGGQMNTVRLLYKSYVVKKSDVLESYTCVDIDDVMAQECMEKYGTIYDSCNASFLIQDLTVKPQFEVEDSYYDLIICTEFLEHINPEKSQAILEELFRVSNPDGQAIFSTPNSNGSNKKLPKDHFYEYSYEELMEKFKRAGWKVEDTIGMSISISKLPKEYVSGLAGVFDRFNKGFGRNSHFQRVAIAPLIKPEYCKNVMYICKKP